MKILCVLLFALVPFLPLSVSASIKITEVAWMGTAGSQYEEWFELYNDGADTSLSGWKMYKAGGSTLLFSLSESIGAGKYLVVCRTTPSVSNPLGGDCDLSGSFGGSGLNNMSEHLVLKDNSGGTVDEINASSGWAGGDASTKETMQLSGTNWVTASETHGSATIEGSGGDEEENNDDSTIATETTSSSSEALKTYPTQLLKLDVPKKAIIGDKTAFYAQAYDFNRARMMRGVYIWNMGNGDVFRFQKTSADSWKPGDMIYYTYEYPGTYTVSVKFYETYFDDVKPNLEEEFTVEAITPTIVISKIYPDGSIEIKNSSSEKMNISEWKLIDSSGNFFVIPKGTFLSSSKMIVFPTKITKVHFGGSASIATPTGGIAYSYGVKNTSTSSKIVTKKESIIEEGIREPQGEVLGEATVSETENEDQEKSGSSIWIISFVVLIGIAGASIFFLRKGEETSKGESDDYKLLDE
jgi:hypothetical protein